MAGGGGGAGGRGGRGATRERKPHVAAEQEALDAFEADMKAAEVDYTLKNYEGATHGFTNPDATEKGKEFELPLAYDEATDEASWAELEALLRSACAG